MHQCPVAWQVDDDTVLIFFDDGTYQVAANGVVTDDIPARTLGLVRSCFRKPAWAIVRQMSPFFVVAAVSPQVDLPVWMETKCDYLLYPYHEDSLWLRDKDAGPWFIQPFTWDEMVVA